MRSRRRIRTALVGGVAAAIILLPGVQSASGHTTQVPALSATVGPGFTITLTTASGQPVTTLVEGTYTINVSDKSTFHNFHLFGPDLNQTTTVAEVADSTWTVTLKRGSYAFICDPHAAGGMRGTFSVVPPTRVAARLTTKQVAGTTTSRRGVGSFTASITPAADGTASMSWNLSFRGLTGAALAAHVHIGLPGVAGPVSIPLCTPCKSGASGTARVAAAALRALLTGGTYVNVHTKQNPGGEIRGQLSVQG